jgi:methyl-accepting chemotaxis protein
MARKDFTMELPPVRSEDEVGRVASAVAELRNDLAEGARMAAEAEEQEAERERQRLEQVRVVDDLKAGLSRLAEGDLTRRIESPPENPFPEGYETLRESYNAVIDRVGGVLARINAIADGVRTVRRRSPRPAAICRAGPRPRPPRSRNPRRRSTS